LDSPKTSKCDTSDFMLEEYKQIVAAFFDLSRQKSDMFRFYLILVTIPITLIAAILGLEEAPPVSLTNLPTFVTLVLVAIAIAGLIMTAVVVDIRFECILYAKTVNLLRRYFIDKEDEQESRNYLVLPDGDDLPRYYEQPWEIKNRKWKWELGVGSTFLEVLLMGLLNATYFGLAVANITKAWICIAQAFELGSISWVSFFALHSLGYRYFAKKKDAQWQVKKRSIEQATGNVHEERAKENRKS
jgi:hypothetical protein